MFINIFGNLAFLGDHCSMFSKFFSFIKEHRVSSYWTFAIVGGLILMYTESIENSEPTWSICGFIFFALLTFWGVKWIVGQIKSALNQKKQKKNVELLHLQSQISPHFLFNTLNNLYGLVEKDTKAAQALILSLSELMRYSTYESQQKSVTIQQEIDFLKDYIKLHEVRYKKNIEINFTEDVEDGQLKILPLLLITILENAFKHGVEKLRKDAFVHIKLITLNDALSFEVKNNFDPEEIGKEQGIGIKNLKRRLAIAYPKRHSYTVTNKNNIYIATLKIYPT